MSWFQGVLDRHPRCCYAVEHVWEEGLAFFGLIGTWWLALFLLA